jgi:hypothetical protein
VIDPWTGYVTTFPISRTASSATVCASPRSDRALGTVLALFANRFFALPDIEDAPTILSGVAALLVRLTVLACLLPARRALAVDPLAALRSE